MAFTLRLLQQNIGGSRQVTEEIRAIAMEQEIDAVLLHEPFNPEERMEEFYPSGKLVTGISEGNNEKLALAGIAIFNDELDVWKVTELCSDRCVCVKVRGDFGNLFLISLYSPLTDDIDSCLTTLQVLLQVLDEQRILIGIDANAKSIWWSNSELTDDRGDKLEDLILSKHLCVLNRKDRLGLTWDGRSYSELSLVSYNIVDRIIEWQSDRDCTSSEGRTIAIELNLMGYGNKNDGSSPTSEGEEEQETDQERTDEMEMIAFAKAKELFEASRRTTLAETESRKDCPWWTDDLENFRREVYKVKLKIQNTSDVNLVHHLKMIYSKRKKMYHRAIRMAKTAYYDPSADNSNKIGHAECTAADTEANIPITSSEGSTLHWDEYVVDFDNESVDDDRSIG